MKYVSNTMKFVSRRLGVAAILTVPSLCAAVVHADDLSSGKQPDRYAVSNLVSDINGLATTTDAVLQNAWGVAFSPAASPFWVADNATGCATLYDGAGAKVVALQVKIPLPGGAIPASACKHVNPASPPNPSPAAPTGMVWNASSAFQVPGTSPPVTASFIFATEDGTISAWANNGLTPSDAAVIAVDNSASGAVYKALVFGTNPKGVFLFATNFRAGTIEVFDHNYASVTTDGNFKDPAIPSGFAPFGLQNINGDLFVTYAKQNAQKHDDVAGRGNGFVDVFDTDGHLLRRLVAQGQLNSPWGVARASYAFGRFSGDVLIGNFGDGKINAFDSNGNFRDTLKGPDRKPIVIDGLWTLTLGGGRNSSSDTLYFTAGPNGETDGLFGTITPVAK
jgi:uncharacterized protein (TIGR03118 family)